MAAEESGKNLEVMNLGVGAAGPNEYVSLVRDSAPIFRPDDVIVVIFANDIPSPPVSRFFISASCNGGALFSFLPGWLPAGCSGPKQW